MKSLILALLGIAVWSSPAWGGERLNVLLIAVDDLRDTLGCYGNAAVRTPNIDRLAARGVRFERAFVQYPVCNPSRSSFLTGLRPDQTGITDNATLLRDKLPEVVTVPQLLKDHGWKSAAFGKIFHLGGGRNAALKSKWMDLPKSWHTAQAFQATPAGAKKLAGRNLTEDKLNWCHWGMMDGGDDDQPDGQIASAVIAQIERLGDEPWIIGCGFMKPHDPFVAPKKYFDLYPDGSLKLRRDPDGQTPAPPLAVGFGEFGEAFGKFTDAERMEFLRAYYACTSFMDAQLGRVLDSLDQLKLWDRTLVVFVGDHGYHLGERNWWNKNTLFDRSCRAPLIVAAPGVKPGVANGLVEFVDLYPTIADYCGLEPPAGLAGRSLRSLLENPAAPGKDAAFTIVTRGPKQRGDSIRTDRWRFTEWSDGARELYDHANDPEETRNVADDNSETVNRLQRRLQAQRNLPREPDPIRFDPVVRKIEGWTVHVEPALIDDEYSAEGTRALTMLANHLQRIKILVPPEPLAKLQSIEIWIEHSHPRLKAMQYHPSRGWLLANGHDERLTQKVHITQARELLSRQQMLKHPAVILHELAHGFHDQILSFDNPDIIAAYDKAKEAGTYENVLLYTGQKVKHYGLNNHKEYFAEGTEAYFYRNDFYPFVRAELKEHDAPLHDVLEKVWGPAK